MPSWIIHAPFTAPDGRDYRPGDTFTSDEAPECDATVIEQTQDDPDKPRRGRPPKQTEAD